MSKLDYRYKRAFEHLYEALGWPIERFSISRLWTAAHQAKILICYQQKRIAKLEQDLARRRKKKPRPQAISEEERALIAEIIAKSSEQGESPASGIQEHRGTAQYPNGSSLPAASSGCEAPPAQDLPCA